MELLRARRMMRILAVVVMSLALAACGAEDGADDAEATTEPPDAQPTVVTTEEAVESTPNFSPEEAAGTPVPTSIDMSTQSDAATPQAEEPGTSTPAPATPVSADEADRNVPGATPAPTVATGATPETGDAESMPASDVVSSTVPGSNDATQGEDVIGDGTTGADIDLPVTTPADGETTPSVTSAPATPVASPLSGEESAATPGAPLVVSGCEVQNVPPFQGEQILYQLAVDLNFRVGPGTECDLVMEDPLGEFQRVEVIGGPVVREDDGSEWVQIRFVDSEGWVSFEYLEPVEE